MIEVPENKARVFVDGELIGMCGDPRDFVSSIKSMRRESKISSQVNLSYNGGTREIIISTSMGRARRPLLIVENGRPLITPNHIKRLKDGEMNFADLVREGVVEYLDAAEEEDTYIAISEEELTEGHTHLEIDPSAILGIGTGMIPYPENNSSPRNTMGA